MKWLVFSLSLILLSCHSKTKPVSNLQFVDYSLTVLSSERNADHSYYTRYTPMVTGRITNMGDTTAYKVRVHVKLYYGHTQDFSPLSRNFESYAEKINLMVGEVSAFKITGDYYDTPIYSGSGDYRYVPAIEIDSIWISYE